ncbi:putative periplasmic serine endoprotease DegP-like [Candidatus Desulfarcum epimagneticum]|uniref:Putative periplasmic serine endoprotease DegP-like n=1 Tax=uncultured Desulfobacteraceae bacterium TaxID=218296 RepID=A0A484HDY8_9BACT|nr:putative periplasmic serine endoprotease DegP-like [uncultured Desulfobacteraceae bacterium]
MKDAIQRTKRLKLAPVFAGMLAAALILAGGLPGLSSQAGAAYAPENFSDLADKISPAVVNIRTEKIVKGGGRVFKNFRMRPFGDDDFSRDFFDRFFGRDKPRDFRQKSLGSGFIIDKEGYIVTNNHVIENADDIKIILRNEQEYDAEIVGRDPGTDLALIKAKSGQNFSVAEMGDSDSLKVGQWVVAIGNPFGLGHTVTAGIVSAKGRNQVGGGPYTDFIQTDASINPGNSGGPLINMEGKVVGINTMIVAGGQGIGFAIPVNLARKIITQLKSKGEVTRGWLGVSIQDLTEEMARYHGVKNKEGALVINVFEGDPADAAGIRPGDIIIAVDGKKVKTVRELTGMIADIGVGDRIRLKVLREGKVRSFDVKIAKRQESKLSSHKNGDDYEDEIGVRVAGITPEVAERLGVSPDEGVIVTGVEEGSKGEKAGILPRDIIREIDHRRIRTADDYRKAVSRYKKGDTAHFFIMRANEGFRVIPLTF